MTPVVAAAVVMTVMRSINTNLFQCSLLPVRADFIVDALKEQIMNVVYLMVEKCMEVSISREENGKLVVSRADVAGKFFDQFKETVLPGWHFCGVSC
jgi:hypothetical protein